LKATGSLFGMAYGDALGRPTEFLTVAEIKQRYGPDGPRDLDGEPALVTDDTEMALAVGWALHDATTARPDVLEPLLRQRFVAWRGGVDHDRAPGDTCLRACAGLAKGVPWQQATIIGSKGCGANMRVTPVGLVPGYDVDTLAGVAQLQAALTHGHPTALAASELTAYTVWLLRHDAELSAVPGMLRDRCHAQRLNYHEEWLGSLWQASGVNTPGEFAAHGWNECLTALDRLDASLALPDAGDDPCLATGAGWTAEEALSTALLCALRHADNPVAALARAATTSGDSDSIACLTGAFLGAAHGMSVWPSAWTDRIEFTDQLIYLGRVWDQPSPQLRSGQ
jgi:ADP-ribosylglycohydrolase